jgi:hypothetical protein
MNAADNYILGGSALYPRLCLITEVLGKFVSCAPRALDLAQLEHQTGRPARELSKLCATLCREQMLRRHPDLPHSWLLACEANAVTLEDAFRCAVAEQSARSRSRQKVPSAQADGIPREVDLLVMQATMSINQSVFQHLRQFSLDRLKMSAAGIFVASTRSDWPNTSLSFS